MKQKNAILLITILILLSVALYWLSDNNSVKNNFGTLAITKTQEINRIELIDLETNEKIILDIKNLCVNETQSASATAINQLIKISGALQIRNTASQNLAKIITDQINKSGIKVSYYTNNQLIKSYKICTITKHKKGTYILTDQSELPVIASIPGESSDILPFFDTNIHYWLSNTIVSLKPSEILKIKLENKNLHQNSFTLIANKKEFEILDFEKKTCKEINRNSIKQYLSYFEAIHHNGLVQNLSYQEVNSITETRPDYEITIESIPKTKIKLSIYSKKNILGKIDINTAYIRINDNNQLFESSYTELDLILKNIDYFK